MCVCACVHVRARTCVRACVRASVFTLLACHVRIQQYALAVADEGVGVERGRERAGRRRGREGQLRAGRLPACVGAVDAARCVLCVGVEAGKLGQWMRQASC